MDLWDKIIPLASVALGSLLTWLPNHFSSSKRQKAEAFAVRKAITAEVESIVRTVEARDYINIFSNTVDEINMQEAIDNSANSELDDPDVWYKCKGKCQVNIGASYNRIYIAHIDKLGLLDPDFAKDVVTFYAYIDSVARDVTPGGILYEGAYIEDFKQSAFVLQRSLLIGDAIVNGKGHVSEKLRRRRP